MVANGEVKPPGKPIIGIERNEPGPMGVSNFGRPRRRCGGAKKTQDAERGMLKARLRRRIEQ